MYYLLAINLWKAYHLYLYIQWILSVGNTITSVISVIRPRDRPRIQDNTEWCEISDTDDETVSPTQFISGNIITDN